jgi:hypothetical protein
MHAVYDQAAETALDTGVGDSHNPGGPAVRPSRIAADEARTGRADPLPAAVAPTVDDARRAFPERGIKATNPCRLALVAVHVRTPAAA